MWVTLKYELRCMGMGDKGSMNMQSINIMYINIWNIKYMKI